MAITPAGERSYWIEVYGGAEAQRLSLDEAVRAAPGSLPCRTALLVDIAVAMRLRDRLQVARRRPSAVAAGPGT